MHRYAKLKIICYIRRIKYDSDMFPKYNLLETVILKEYVICSSIPKDFSKIYHKICCILLCTHFELI